MNLPLKLIAAGCIALFLSACSTTYTNQNPTGALFPQVSGENLEKEQVNIPQNFSGAKTLLLIGYVQNAQFDIDRWLIGLDMTSTDVNVYELPTIAGMFPKFFETQINNGMRKGIPKSLWKGVVTIYDDGEKVQKLTGNENPNNARVVLLDEQGKIIYFDDKGFSVESLKKVRNLVGASE